MLKAQEDDIWIMAVKEFFGCVGNLTTRNFEGFKNDFIISRGYVNANVINAVLGGAYFRIKRSA